MVHCDLEITMINPPVPWGCLPLPPPLRLTMLYFSLNVFGVSNFLTDVAGYLLGISTKISPVIHIANITNKIDISIIKNWYNFFLI